jgi:hypothetical protein
MLPVQQKYEYATGNWLISYNKVRQIIPYKKQMASDGKKTVITMDAVRLLLPELSAKTLSY